MSDREVSFDCGGDRIRAHLADCGRGASAPALVLAPDVHGLSDLYRELAGRFASRGLSTLVVDLYSREGAPKLASPAEAMAWIATLPDPRILADLQAAVDFLASPPSSRKVGITGFCMGGQYALLAACSIRGVAGCVSFYGMVRYPERNELKPQSPLDVAADLTCPYLGIFGEDDALIPRPDVEELRERLTAAGKRFEIRSYPGCGHAFLNHTRPDAYRPQAAADAFERAVRFFEEHLSAR
ncbi:MAG: dienelactone hydrolase family protein [Candidatus Binatia bacterium]